MLSSHCSVSAAAAPSAGATPAIESSGAPPPGSAGKAARTRGTSASSARTAGAGSGVTARRSALCQKSARGENAAIEPPPPARAAGEGSFMMAGEASNSCSVAACAAPRWLSAPPGAHAARCAAPKRAASDTLGCTEPKNQQKVMYIFWLMKLSMGARRGCADMMASSDLLHGHADGAVDAPAGEEAAAAGGGAARRAACAQTPRCPDFHAFRWHASLQ